MRRLTTLVLSIVGSIALIVLLYSVLAQVMRPPVDEARSAAARAFIDTELATRWSLMPWAREALGVVEIRGTEMLVLTTAPSKGDVRKQIAPTCFTAMDYVEQSSNRLQYFRILANDGSVFQFNPKEPCLMAGY